MGRVSHGFGADLVTPLIGKSTPSYADERGRIRDEMLQEVSDTGISSVDDAEAVQADKIGPFSIQLPFLERIPDVQKYYTRVPVEYDKYALRKAIDLVARQYEAHSLYPLSIDEAFKQMPKGTNLGAPIFSSKPEYLETVLRLAKEVEIDGFRSREVDPCILFWRGQPRGLHSLPKQRVVWGYPHYVTIHELRIQSAALPILQSKPEFAALRSADAVNHVITRIINEARTHKVNVMSVDFSGFDASAPDVLIDAAFEVIEYMFSRSSKRLLEWVKVQFKTIRMITPIGILRGLHGVPSGSGLTNWIGNVIQQILAHYCGFLLGNPILELTTQGDDGVWLFSRPWIVEAVHKIVLGFGMNISADKGGVSRDTVYYLQNIHDVSYTVEGLYPGVRPILRAINGMLSFEYPRSKDWLGVDNTFRWLQQAESCKHHPRVSILAEFLFAHDAMLQDHSLYELILMAGGMSAIEAAIKQKSFPYGKEPISKVNEFTIVKEIDKLAGGRFLRGGSGR